MFDRAEFDVSFTKNLSSLKKAEKATKELVRHMSREVLEAHHVTGDVKYINEFVSVLTPMNRKVAIMYFNEFSGHNEMDGVFGKKNKKGYDEALAKSNEFLEDPMNNMWSWAERNVKVEKKAIDYKAKIIKDIQASMDADKNENPLDESEVLEAVLAAGISAATILRLMEKIAAE